MNKIRIAVSLWAVLLGVPGPAPLRAQAVLGDWQGTLDVPQKLRTILKVSQADDGHLRADLYSIDQTTDPIPADTFTLEGTTVKFAISIVHGSYQGTLSADGNSMVGKWTQGGTNELDLKRVTKDTEWPIDSAKHTIQFVTVEPGVKLEVVDWGGTGRPLVLLTGLGNNAHIFDSFAPKLTDKYHVYGITRRGYGASDTPTVTSDSYSADRLGDDVIAVLDHLNLMRPVLAGHSIAGEELSSIGSRHPERVAGLIYLDAGYPYALYDASRGDTMIDGILLRKKLDALTDAHTPQQQRAIVSEMLKVDLPQYEKDLTARQKELEGVPDSPTPPETMTKSRQAVSGHAILEGQQQYTQIKCPVLAIFADPHDRPGPQDPKAKAAAEAEDLRSTEGQAKAFEKLVPTAKVVRIPHANHFVFKSNEADVLREINAFVAGLPQ